MAFSLSYYNVVKTDIIEAKDWYKNQSAGLEKKFAIEVRNCIHKLQKSPLSYEIKYKNVRMALTAIFPYAVHFYIDDDKQQIVIIAIIHQNRNPAIAYNREE